MQKLFPHGTNRLYKRTNAVHSPQKEKIDIRSGVAAVQYDRLTPKTSSYRTYKTRQKLLYLTTQFFNLMSVSFPDFSINFSSSSNSIVVFQKFKTPPIKLSKICLNPAMYYHLPEPVPSDSSSFPSNILPDSPRLQSGISG